MKQHAAVNHLQVPSEFQPITLVAQIDQSARCVCVCVSDSVGNGMVWNGPVCLSVLSVLSEPPSQFSAHLYCGTAVDRGPGHIVLDMVPAHAKRAPQPPPALFGPCLLWPRSPI